MGVDNLTLISSTASTIGARGYVSWAGKLFPLNSLTSSFPYYTSHSSASFGHGGVSWPIHGGGRTGGPYIKSNPYIGCPIHGGGWPIHQNQPVPGALFMAQSYRDMIGSFARTREPQDGWLTSDSIRGNRVPHISILRCGSFAPRANPLSHEPLKCKKGKAATGSPSFSQTKLHLMQRGSHLRS